MSVVLLDVISVHYRYLSMYVAFHSIIAATNLKASYSSQQNHQID